MFGRRTIECMIGVRGAVIALEPPFVLRPQRSSMGQRLAPYEGRPTPRRATRRARNDWPVVARKVGKFDPDTKGQREPLRVLFHPSGFDLVPGSAMPVEDSEDEPPATVPAAKPEN